jgi:hypothetical protein
MEIIQEIGSYAGFAAVLGLAVLSALYFSQARDVKRLREWAGRAPERGPQAQVEPRTVVAQPIARPASKPVPGGTPPPVPRPPGAQPATPAATPAQAAAAGAAPAVAKGPAPATPAAATATPGGGDSAGSGDGDDSPETDVTAMDTVVHPPPEPPGEEPDEEGEDKADPDVDEDVAPDAEVGLRDEPAEPAGLDEDTGEWSPEDEHSDLEFTDEHDVVPATPAASIPRPPTPPRPFPRRTVPPPSGRYGRERSPILPPYGESGSVDDEPEEDRGSGSGRRVVLAAIAALVVLAVGAFAVLQVTGGDDSGGSDGGGAGLSASGTNDGASGDGGGQAPAVDPSDVTVAVLNGTRVPGLAATLGDKIAGEGFRLGTVTNNFDQERAESVVLYTPGAEREAADVSRRLDIPQREAIDTDSQALAGDATVVVVAGADQSQ